MLISIALSLFSTFTVFVMLSAPFCVLQLALCKFCPIGQLQYAPLVLFGAGFLWSWWYMTQASGWENLLGFLVMLPCILGLIGSGVGWFLWKKHPQ